MTRMRTAFRHWLMIGFFIGIFWSSLLQAEVKCLEGLKPNLSQISETELFRRLIFAEAVSLGLKAHAECSRDSVALMEAIAWGVKHRTARPRRRQLRDVILEPGQFNPALSPRSRYRRYFACPTKEITTDSELEFLWNQAEEISSRVAAESIDSSPFRRSKKPDPAHFYYPKSSQATARPPKWADTSRDEVKRRLIEGVKLSEVSVSHACLHFFAGRSQ